VRIGRRRRGGEPSPFDVRRDELANLVRQSRDVILIAAATGAAVGVAVRIFEFVVVEVLLHRVTELDPQVLVMIPVVGLVTSAVILRYLGGGLSQATTDDYLRAFHDPGYVLRPRQVMVRITAAMVTLGSGGALGLEGPSLYGGSSLGQQIQRRLPKPFQSADHRTLLVAGAAAGVAAIFKAPATGAIFALEVPYRNELARRALLPALVSAASGYLTFVALSTTDPIFRIVDVPVFSFRDLFGALVIGVTCAVGARGFAKLIRMAKVFSTRPIGMRVLFAGAGLIGLFVASRLLTGENLTIGSGYEAITGWLIDPELAIWLIVVIFIMRCLASALTLAGGGVGGVFIPLVVGGAFVGRAVGGVINPDRYTLYTLLGIAAFLGAGYRVPLAAVMFVAETTGRPNFVVPALFAAVAAELVMGEHSITEFQRRPQYTTMS
jgi:CIC family chloride channel protein